MTLSIVGYCKGDDTWAYPYLKIHSRNVKPPVSLDDALNQLDLVLKEDIIAHFKNEKEPFATINIRQELASFFINRWDLRYNLKLDYQDYKMVDKPPVLLNYFTELEIVHPYLIMCVVFDCYHKKLNNVEYSIENEVEAVKNEFNSSLYEVVTNEQYLNSLQNIKTLEDSVLSFDKLNHYNINDTLGSRYLEIERKSIFYISGIIESIDTTNNLTYLKVFDIVSDKRYRVAHYDNQMLKIGDTINISLEDWHKLNELFFNYRYGRYQTTMIRWNEYIKRKYHEN